MVGNQMTWVYGGHHGNMDRITNPKTPLDPRYSLFAPYLKSLEIYKCPEDKSKIGKLPKLRSYSMNSYVADTPDGQFTPSATYKSFRRMQDVATPSDIFLTMDVNPDTICMPHFRVMMDSPTWFHVPSTLHKKSGVLSFIDGHVESHKWKSINIRLGSGMPHNFPAPKGADLYWVRLRTTYPVTGKAIAL
jgi:hypothetical protein